MLSLEEIIEEQQKYQGKYKVDICLTCYNQKEYIEDAVLGILNQKTNVPYRIVIGDDGSTDGSREILRKYEEKYPEKIVVLYHEKNMGLFKNRKAMFKVCNAPYAAFCDGDDYWIDEGQLQRKFEFLEMNYEYIGYFTGGQRVDNDEIYQKNDLTDNNCHHDFDKESALHNDYPGLIDGFFFRNIYKYMTEEEFECYTSFQMDDSSKLPIVAGIIGKIYRSDKVSTFACRQIANSRSDVKRKRNCCKDLWITHRWMIDMVDFLFEGKEHMQIDSQLEVLAVDSFYTALKTAFKSTGKDNWRQFQYIFNDKYFTKLHICRCIVHRFCTKILKNNGVQR